MPQQCWGRGEGVILYNEGYLIKYDENDMVIGITHTVVNMVDVLD